MGLTIYPEFEQEIPEIQRETTGEMLAAFCYDLDEIAEMAGLVPIGRFADNREVPDDFDGDPDELDQVMEEWTEWFPSEEGLAAFTTLSTYLKEHPSAAGPTSHIPEVVLELDDCARQIKVAAEKGIRFRLQMR